MHQFSCFACYTCCKLYEISLYIFVVYVVNWLAVSCFSAIEFSPNGFSGTFKLENIQMRFLKIKTNSETEFSTFRALKCGTACPQLVRLIW